MKRRLKSFGAILLSLCLLLSSNTVNASQYNNRSFKYVDLWGANGSVTIQDSFIYVNSERYSDYSFRPCKGNSIKVRLQVVDYQAYKFIPNASLELYTLGGTLVGRKVFKTTMGFHEYTFNNLDESYYYYIKLTSGPNCSTSIVMYISLNE